MGLVTCGGDPVRAVVRHVVCRADDYALQLQFGREFAIVFPLVLDAVISVLAVTVLLERALRRRTVVIKGWQVTLRWPTWPLIALWSYFGGSVAGNVAHAPQLLEAQLVAAVPPISAALTFHLLLRLLDRAPMLKMIAEMYDERSIEQRERAAQRRARRAQLKPAPIDRSAAVARTASTSVSRSDNGQSASPDRDGRPLTNRRGVGDASMDGVPWSRTNGGSTAELEELRRRVHAAIASGERVTGVTVGQWLGVSARTGRRRLSVLLRRDPGLIDGLARSPEAGLVDHVRVEKGA